jgi:hypothetical protein
MQAAPDASHRSALRGMARLALGTGAGALAALLPLFGAPAAAQQAPDVAAQLANPVANLISVPFQNNLDFGGGRGNALRYLLNVQPVVPISLSQDWNLITRTIIPITYTERVLGEHRAGLGDVVQSFFLSPSQPVGGVTWGVGPVFLYPTGTNGYTQRQWGVGPTGVALRQSGQFMYGALANHIVSLGGTPDRSERINATFLNPFVSYLIPGGTTLTLQTESTYDWERRQWTVPIVGVASQLVQLGGQTVQLGLGARYYAERPQGGPDWGLRFAVSFVFPR